MLYRGSFAAGFGPLIRRLLARDYPHSVDAVPAADDSSILFRADRLARRPPYLKNVAAVLDSRPAADLEKACALFADGLTQKNTRESLTACTRNAAFFRGKTPATFVLRTLDQGEPSAVGKAARTRLEERIRGLTGLRPDSERPDLVVQVQRRSDGTAYLVVPEQERHPEQVPKGALPDATARLLCELSRPGPQDVFLDPFMGSGAIVLERARLGAFKMLFAGDADAAAVEAFKERLKEAAWSKRRRLIFPKLMDARDLSRFEPDFINVIVTDPPWGLYTDLDRRDLADLYARFLTEARRVLAPAGRLVLLTSRDVPLPPELDGGDQAWRLTEEYLVLVSGLKARALVLEKGSERGETDGDGN